MKSMSLKSRVETAEELLHFLAACKIALRRSVVPVYLVVDRLTREENYPHLGFLKPWATAMREGADPAEAWTALPGSSLPPGLWEGFAGFCRELGQSDRAAQEALCDAYTDLLSANLSGKGAALSKPWILYGRVSGSAAPLTRRTEGLSLCRGADSSRGGRLVVKGKLSGKRLLSSTLCKPCAFPPMGGVADCAAGAAAAWEQRLHQCSRPFERADSLERQLL